MLRDVLLRGARGQRQLVHARIPATQRVQQADAQRLEVDVADDETAQMRDVRHAAAGAAERREKGDGPHDEDEHAGGNREEEVEVDRAVREVRWT